MVGRLEKEGYVETKHYKGARLTEEGLKQTLDIIKRHRLLELFLIEILQYNWEEVHQEAEILEHRISDLFVERLDKILNFRKHALMEASFLEVINIKKFLLRQFLILNLENVLLYDEFVIRQSC